MGKVFEAVHLGTSRRVAVKVIIAEALKKKETVKRFEREARAAGAIDSQHLVEIIDVGTDPATHRPFMVMELMNGEDAGALVKRVGPLEPDIAMRIVAQAARGLRKAHEFGVIHRDIKPANLFLAEKDDEEILVKILDFGIAKVKMQVSEETTDTGLTRTGAVMGSPLYMAPEQARGRKKIDHRADLWSLGVVLYQLLAGRTPFHDIRALGELIIAICGEPVPPLQKFAPWVDPAIAHVVHAALQPDPAARFQTADEFITALGPLLPRGYRLDKSELVSIPEAERAVEAERFDVIGLLTGSDLASAAVATPSASDGRPPGPAPASDAATGARERTQNAMSHTGTEVERGGPKHVQRLALIAALVAVVAIGGWWLTKGGATTAATPATSSASAATPIAFSDKAPLVILADSFSGYSTFRRAEFAEAMSKSGTPIAYRDEVDQAKRAEMLSDGTADLIATTLDQFLEHRPKGKIVALLDATIGADAVVVNNKRYPELTSLGDLADLVAKDKEAGRKPTISYAGGTASAYLALLLDARFDSFDLEAFAIEKVDGAAAAWAKLSAPDSELAAAILWQPFVERARLAGYNVVLSSADVPDSIVDVLVASDRLLAQGAIVEDVVRNYYRRIDTGIVRRGTLAQQIAEDAELSEADAGAVLAGIELFTAVSASRWFETKRFDKRIAATGAILTLAGRLDKPPSDPSQLYDGKYVALAADSTRALISSISSEQPELARRLEGAEQQHGAGTDIDPTTLQGAAELGDLGQVTFSGADVDANGKKVIDDAAADIDDFNAASTVVTLTGRAADQPTGLERAASVRAQLRGKGIRHPMSVGTTGVKGAGEQDRVTIKLVRAPK